MCRSLAPCFTHAESNLSMRIVPMLRSFPWLRARGQLREPTCNNDRLTARRMPRTMSPSAADARANLAVVPGTCQGMPLLASRVRWPLPRAPDRRTASRTSCRRSLRCRAVWQIRKGHPARTGRLTSPIRKSAANNGLFAAPLTNSRNLPSFLQCAGRGRRDRSTATSPAVRILTTGWTSEMQLDCSREVGSADLRVATSRRLATRKTSSSVVMPSNTLRMPSS